MCVAIIFLYLLASNNMHVNKTHPCVSRALEDHIWPKHPGEGL